MAVGDVWNLKVVGRFKDQNIVNTFQYRINEQVDDEKDIGDKLCNQWTVELEQDWLDLHSIDYYLIGLKAYVATPLLSRPPGFKYVYAAGTVVGDAHPAPYCRVITLYPEDDANKRHGRLQLSGTANSHVQTTGGGFTEAAVTALQAFGDGVVGGLSGEGNVWDLGLLGKPPLTWTKIIKATGRATAALIRSRAFRRLLIG